MKTLILYMVVCAHSPQGISVHVQEKLKEDWTLQGSCFIGKSDGSGLRNEYCQTLIKKVLVKK